MNLKESIRRIIREEIGIIPIRRRFFIVDDYIKNLNPKDVCTHWSVNEVDDYMNVTMSDIAREMVQEIPNVVHDNWIDNYDTVYDMLFKLGFPDKIKDFFNDSINNCDNVLQESVRRILKEETSDEMFIRRRLHELDNLLVDLVKNEYGPNKICNYRNSEEYIEHLIFNIINDHMYYIHFDHIDDTSGEWGKLFRIMEGYLRGKYESELETYYHTNCGD